jgi:subtilisin family serine protease
MASKKAPPRRRTAAAVEGANTSSSIDDLLLGALAGGTESFETGRMLVTFKEGAGDAGVQSQSFRGLRIADARDWKESAVNLESAADADALRLPEIGVMVVGGTAAAERGLSAASESFFAADSTVEAIEPEHFIFSLTALDLLGAYSEAAPSGASEYLRGFLRATEVIARDLREGGMPLPGAGVSEEAMVSGATWGIQACRVPQSTRSGNGIKVAVLDTGMDLGHPDFAGRINVANTKSFVGQPVQDLHSHGTHCIGTACGPKAPAGTTPRYGVAFRSQIFVGKVLSNSGGSVDGSVLAGMEWAIANRCEVISMSLGGQRPPVVAYTTAGQRALNAGLLMIAAAGNAASSTGAPANSPTIMSVSALNPNLTLWAGSNRGKVEIAGPGVDVFSSVPRPTRYGIKTGTSMATPHVAGCAALWAETSPSLRGMNLWRRLEASARALPLPPTHVGRGLVQAPA